MSAIEVDLLECVEPWVVRRRPVLKVVEPLEPFFCDVCGNEFGVKPRQARAIRAGTRKQTCTFCVGTGGGKRLIPVKGIHRQFWLERFSMQEILEIAEAAWGPVADWTPEWREGFVFECEPSRIASPAS